MARIFICYRREDSAGHAGRLYDYLQQVFGDDVFMDVEGIDGGIDFEEHIRKVVGSCDALIALIGPRWSQLWRGDSNDVLHSEIKMALEGGIRVIPLLVDDARFPAGGLPEDLMGLGRRQVMEIRNSHWKTDVERLIDVLKRVPRVGPPVQPPPPVSKGVWGGPLLAIGAVVILLVGLIGADLLQRRRGSEIQPPASEANNPDSEKRLPVTTSVVASTTVVNTTTSVPPTSTIASTTSVTSTTSVVPSLMCVQRWSRPGEAGVACQSGEVLSGGGCTCPGGTLRSSYTSGQDGASGTAWQCDGGQCSNGGFRAVAVCCQAVP
jgi:hypothetical protein